MFHKYLFPILRQIYFTIGDPVFRQDNARIHISNIIQIFSRYNIDVADHPPYSLDLNPIEHAWVLLKRQVTEYCPDLADTPGCLDTLKAQLAEVLPLSWEKLLETQLDTL